MTGIEFDPIGCRCKRCRQEILVGDHSLVFARTFQGPLYDGDTIASFTVYHGKCLPPNVFHRLAGSLPVGQSPAASSLGNEHAARGGLSIKRRTRKRLARRQRYKATARRELAKREEREQRIEARAQELTPDGEIEATGKLRLCSCQVFSKEGYFVTKNWYCRYCGGWKAHVLSERLGEAALLDRISELDLHYRTEMLQQLGLSSER